MDWRGAFAEVFHDGGFDIVVANPPDVSRNTLNKENPALLKALIALYDTADGRAFDLFGCFIERAVEIMKPGGTLSYIVPSGWYTGAGFSALRRFLATQTDPLVMVNLPHDVFAAAWVDTTVFIAARRVPPTPWPRRTSTTTQLQSFSKREQLAESEDFNRGAVTVDVASWFADGSDLFLTRSDSAVVQLIRRIETRSRCLGDASVADIQRGVTPFQLAEQKTRGMPFELAFAGTVRRYVLDRGPERFIRFDDTLAEPKSERYFHGPRLLLRELISRQFRLQAVYTDESFVTNKSMQSILPVEGGPRVK